MSTDGTIEADRRQQGGAERLGLSLPRLIMRLGLAAGIAALAATAAEASPDSIALPGEAVYPESVTATADGTLFVSSFVSGGIQRVPPGGASAEPFIKPGAHGSRSTFGVMADEATGTLWVCSNDLSALGIKGPSEEPGSALKGFDLTTGEGRVSARLPGARTLCNDIAIGPDGAVYVTNSFAPEILRLAPGSDRLEVWASDPQFHLNGPGAGLDGIAFGRDGALIVTTFTKPGLYRIAVEGGRPGAVTRLTPSRPLVLPDGLRAESDGSFLLTEGAGRLDRVTIEGGAARIETLREGIAGGATAVTRVGDTAFVTEGQLALVTDPSKKGQSPQLPFKLHAVPLK